MESAKKNINLYIFDIYACDRDSYNSEVHQGQGSSGSSPVNDDTASINLDDENES